MVIMTPCTGDQLYPRRPTVSPNRPSLTVLIFPFGFFSYHQEYFQIINMTADYFGCKRTCVPMGKGHPEEPSGLYRKAAQHFEVLGTSRRKRGLELELAKKNCCWPQLQFFLLYKLCLYSRAVWWCWGTWALLWKAKMTKGMRVMSPCVRQGLKGACQALCARGGPNPSKRCSLLLASSS